MAATLMEVLSLQRYLAWSEQMRQDFERLLQSNVGISMRTKEGQEMFCYLAYWYAGLYAVVEGWHCLKLADPTIDALLESPNVEHLRRFRDGMSKKSRDRRSVRQSAAAAGRSDLVQREQRRASRTRQGPRACA